MKVVGDGRGIMKRHSFRGFFIVMLIMMVLSSCDKSRIKPQDITIKDVQSFLDLAKISPEPEKSEHLLSASALLIQQTHFLKAQDVLSRINPDYLSDLQRDDYYLYYGQTLQALQQTKAAFSLLDKIQYPEQHSIEWQISYRKTLSLVYLDQNNYYEAAKIRIELEDLLLDAEDVANNHQFIWQALGQIETDFLDIYRNDFNDATINGWLEVVELTKAYRLEPDKLVSAFELWRQRYPSHPANLQTPPELEGIIKATTYQPKRIALLLPLSGKLSNRGRMIRDGFLAAHYTQPWSQDVPHINLYDTHRFSDIGSVYHQAILDGAEFIVGPLTKSALSGIAALPSRTHPILALNRLDLENTEEFTPEYSLNELYQFGLPREDEAKQIALHAIEKGQTQALVLVPNSKGGEHIAKTFSETFESLEGKINEVKYFDSPKELKNIVRDLLNISRSDARKIALENQLGQEIFFVQRRRQDVDMIFLSASPEDARQIKPFFNFFFAQDLPVYAISSINDGSKNIHLNADLNGITFTDSPFFISNQTPLKALREQLSQDLPSIHSPFGRLFALGFDAYQIIPELNKLQSFNQYQFPGLTGTLMVNENGVISRKLSIAKFKEGSIHEIISEQASPQETHE